MTCLEFREQLDDWLRAEDELADAPLDAARAAGLRRHAVECGACRKLHAETSWLQRSMLALGRPEPPADFAERIAAQLQAAPAAAPVERPRQSPGRRWLQPLAYAVALAAAVIVAVRVLPSRRSELVRRAPAEPKPRDSAVAADLDETIRTTGSAYLALARQMAEAVRLEPAAAPPPQPTLPAMELAMLPVQQTMRESTNSLRTATYDLETTIRPITASATNAFSFLWRDVPARSQPAGSDRNKQG